MGCMFSHLAAKFAFFPPSPPTYQIKQSHGGKLTVVSPSSSLTFPTSDEDDSLDVLLIDTKRGNKIVGFFLKNPYARLTVLYSHGNAADLGQLYDLFVQLKVNLRINLMGYDYSGYGASTGKPSEYDTYADIEAVYECLQTEYGISQEDLILYGQSVGSGPTLHLAAKLPRLRGVVLHSGILSGLRVLCHVNFWFCFDIYSNINKIKKVKCQVLVIHGTEDDVVNWLHGNGLWKMAREPYDPLWIKGGGHCNLEVYPDYIRHLYRFIQDMENTTTQTQLKKIRRDLGLQDQSCWCCRIRVWRPKCHWCSRPKCGSKCSCWTPGCPASCWKPSCSDCCSCMPKCLKCPSLRPKCPSCVKPKCGSKCSCLTPGCLASCWKASCSECCSCIPKCLKCPSLRPKCPSCLKLKCGSKCSCLIPGCLASCWKPSCSDCCSCIPKCPKCFSLRPNCPSCLKPKCGSKCSCLTPGCLASCWKPSCSDCCLCIPKCLKCPKCPSLRLKCPRCLKCGGDCSCLTPGCLAFCWKPSCSNCCSCIPECLKCPKCPRCSKPKCGSQCSCLTLGCLGSCWKPSCSNCSCIPKCLKCSNCLCPRPKCPNCLCPRPKCPNCTCPRPKCPNCSCPRPKCPKCSEGANPCCCCCCFSCFRWCCAGTMTCCGGTNGAAKGNDEG